MQAQLAGWERGRLIEAMALLAEAEAQMRTTGLPEASIAQQTLVSVAMRRARGRN